LLHGCLSGSAAAIDRGYRSRRPWAARSPARRRLRIDRLSPEPFLKSMLGPSIHEAKAMQPWCQGRRLMVIYLYSK
jgi:hypothetical protein